MGGAKSLQILTTPKATPLCKSSGKKLPETLAALLTPEDVKGRRVRLMFQDEARFGRIVRIRRCWSPAPLRPSVSNGYQRQFVYVYAAVSPIEGEMDWMVSPNMNTEQMSNFLSRVSNAHPDDFIVMVLDVASSHKAKELQRPENIRLVGLPPYSPEFNPQEHNMFGMSFERKNSLTECLTILTQ